MSLLLYVLSVYHCFWILTSDVQIEDTAKLKFEVLPPRPDYFQFNAKQTFQMLEPKPKPRLKKVVYGFNGQKRLVAGRYKVDHNIWTTCT